MENEGRTTVIVDGRTVDVGQQPLLTERLIAASGIIGSGIVIRIDEGRASLVPSDTEIPIAGGGVPSFRTFRGDTVFHLRVEGMVWDWGDPAIREGDVREIAHAPDDVELSLDRGGTSIRRGSVIDLTGEWPPHIHVSRSTSGPTLVPITVNGRRMLLDRPDVTFEDLVSKAYPDLDPASPGMRSLTVTYRRGPPARPEGSLVPREATRVLHGTAFHVTATDKS